MSKPNQTAQPGKTATTGAPVRTIEPAVAATGGLAADDEPTAESHAVIGDGSNVSVPAPNKSAAERQGGSERSEPIRFGPSFPLPIAPISQGTTAFIHTGSWRYLKPRYVNKVPPCRVGCPAAMPVERVMTLVEGGKYEAAIREILDENPFPGICGRVCYHPCETACNRGQYDSPLAIQLTERFIADETADLDLQLEGGPRQKESVAIVGGGPAGMAAAYFLLRLGYQVTLFEAENRLGGILRYGIPPYRLPRAILDQELNRVVALGLKVQSGVRVGRDIPWSALRGFNARMLAPGLGKSRLLGIAGEDAQNAESGLEFLRRFNTEGPRHIGKKLVVIGGGNTAIDVVRTAIRAGCGDVNLLYRRTRAEMPALAGEVDEADREGVAMSFLSLPIRFIVDTANRVVAVEAVKMKLSEPDESNRPRPIPIPGSEWIIETDHVVVAVGESEHASAMPDDAALCREQAFPLIQSGDQGEFYVGGDLSNDTLTVVSAIASGKRAAIAIDSDLRGRLADWKAIRVADGGLSFTRYLGKETPGHNRSIAIDRINPDYFKKQERARTPRLSVRVRVAGFEEVNLGYAQSAAEVEAKRCFHCGVCTACDNCYIFCPDAAVEKKPDNTFSIRYEYCKGCGICATECPRGALDMVADEEGINDE
ncbi:MAG: FAD-dependent oxidoreductase [Deltaproteobacteria bacterium]|nr:FAD-dependent oxidoreductase [Deltaproteobacteria bacterium]